MRFQEHYESPQFRGKYFSRREYKKWYRAQRGQFSYFADWSGFNIPSSMLEPFADGRFKRLSRRERTLMQAFEDKDGLFYIIGTYKTDSPSTLNHEISHGMFFINEKYRQEVLAELDKVDLGPIEKYLASTGGYHPSVWRDEAQAYLINNRDTLEHHGIDLGPYLATMGRLQDIFRRYTGLRPY
ncbi:MAG: ABC transporter ATP-binding protein, partial [Deltaproteobacteria bacterium]|nr:ABC transporter ATP-binding protein [Deltaproteobacteria bacterium]